MTLQAMETCLMGSAAVSAAELLSAASRGAPVTLSLTHPTPQVQALLTDAATDLTLVPRVMERVGARDRLVD